MKRTLQHLAMVLAVASLGTCAFFSPDAPPVASELGDIGIAASSSARRPSEIVVFGDSLSDAGNSHIGSLHIRAPSPPYYFGRFSDGPTWVELFAAHYRLQARAFLRGGTNFAVGGAKVASGMDSLPNQLQLYLWLNAFSRPDPRRLYVIFGGGNDIRQALKDADPAPILALAAFRIRRMIEHLTQVGAVDFLVPNVPNRGHAPAAHARGTVDREVAMTQAFNHALDLALQDLPTRSPIHLVRADFWSSAEAVFATPGRWGFANAWDPCMVPVKEGGPPDYKICAAPESYAFWDDIHPTLSGHRFLAEVAIAAWEQSANSPIAISASKNAPNALEDEVLRRLRDHIAHEKRE